MVFMGAHGKLIVSTYGINLSRRRKYPIYGWEWGDSMHPPV